MSGLARAAAESAPMEGRALFAANRALPWPAESVAALWHACTLLREHRGDGHVAALTAAGIGGREANVLQAAAGRVPREVFRATRHYDDAEWDSVSAGLFKRDLVGRDGRLTARGKDVRDDVEDRTDRISLTAYDVLDDEQISQLLDCVRILGRKTADPGCGRAGAHPASGRRPETGYNARWTRSASSSSASRSAGRLPICRPRRSTATDRICSAWAFEFCLSPVCSARRRT